MNDHFRHFLILNTFLNQFLIQFQSFTGEVKNPTISVIDCAEHSNCDQAVELYTDLGGGNNMTVQNDELKRVIEAGRKEIKDAQDKLNSSLTTPIVESEAKVIQNTFLIELSEWSEQ